MPGGNTLHSVSMTALSLKQVLDVLQELAPLEGAAAWDNCGLIMEPLRTRPVRRILLTIDLTAAVAAEALRKK